MNGYNIPLIKTVSPKFNKIIYLDKIDSTNNFAKNLILKNKCEDNTVIIANSQTSGRGKGTSSFFSPASVGLYMSIVLTHPSSDLIFLSMATALAIAQAIKETSFIDAFIKWPNDILINNKKVCGILIESTTNCTSESLNHVIIGLGVNVNNETEFDSSIKNIATSIFLETGKYISRNTLCCNILKQFEIILNENKKNLFLKYKSYLRV